jgi:hypothetical protein
VVAGLAASQALLVPRSLVLVVSPSIRQSQETFRKVLDLYWALGRPVATDQESALRLELVNGSRVVSLPGTEQTVRGFSNVSLLIVEESARVSDALYYSVRPFLATSGGRLVALSTPFGRRGWFWEAWERGDGWQRVKVTADQCPRITKEFLAAELKAMGQRYFNQEYGCSFEAVVDAYFDGDSIRAALVDAEATLDLDWSFGDEGSTRKPAAQAPPPVDEDAGPAMNLDWSFGGQ